MLRAMPFTFLSHQAAVVPLKMARPRWFSGTALAVGSMAPDLEYFLRGQPLSAYGHIVRGQFTFCLPITLVVTWLITRVVARALGPALPDLGDLHLRDYQLAGARADTAWYWAAAVWSALIGSFSHLWWDGFTHDYGAGVQRFEILQRSLGSVGGYTLYIYKILQHSSTILGAALTLLALLAIGRRRSLVRWASLRADTALPHAAPAESRRFWGWCMVAALASAGAGAALAGGVAPWPSPWWWVAASFRAVVFGFAGLCVICALSPSARAVTVRAPAA
ncbi:MAG: DUF4184 family protein [Gemmatimonadaceae bacterium]